MMVRRFFILALMLTVAINTSLCLCSHEKKVEVATSHSCHEQSSETKTQKHSTPSKGCCCIDKNNASEMQDSFVLTHVQTSSDHPYAEHVKFQSYIPVNIAFHIDRNFRPPSSQLPIYFSKHSFLI